MSVTTENVLKALRVNLPGAVMPAIRLALRDAVADLCKEALQIAPPTEATSDPAGWMSDALWIEHQTLIISGALSRLFAQPSKPYTNLDLAKAHGDLFSNGLRVARTTDASAAVPSNAYERLRRDLRVEVPAARDPALNQALYRAVDSLCRNVLQKPMFVDDRPAFWLSDDDYAEHRELLFHGTMAALYAQVGQPWTNGEAVKFHGTAWQDGVAAARAHLAKQLVYSRPDEIMRDARQVFPQARDDTLTSAMHFAASWLAREVLQASVPDSNLSPDTWFTADQWIEHRDIVRDGMYAELYSQVHQPWASPELAKTFQGARDRKSTLARAVLSKGSVPDAISRVMSILREMIPQARDGTLTQAMYVAVSRLSQDGLQSTRPTQSSNPATWLTTDMWEEHWRVVLDGALTALYRDTAQPWGNAEAYKNSATAFEAGIVHARQIAGAKAKVVSAYDRIMGLVRTAVPYALDQSIQQAYFRACDMLARQAIQTALPDQSAEPNAYLPMSVTSEHWQTLYEGTLGELLSQVGQPYANPELGLMHRKVFEAGLAMARAIVSAQASATSTIDRIQRVMETQVPAARDGVLMQALYGAVERLCRMALQTASPNQSDAPEQWLPEAQYYVYQRTLIHGALADVFSQTAQAWGNVEAARYHLDQWETGLIEARADYASGQVPTGAFSRVMAILRTEVPKAKDPEIIQSLWLAVDKLARDGLLGATPSAAADPATWLTNDQWGEHARLLVDGALAYLFTQVKQPWADVAAAKIHQDAFNVGFAAVRQNNVRPANTALDQILSDVMAQVPLIRRSAVEAQLFKAVDWLTRDWLQTNPPAPGTLPSQWMSSVDYAAYYRTLLDATLAGVYAEPGVPWFSAEAARTHSERATIGALNERNTLEGTRSTPSAYDRMLVTLRTNAPGARDAVILTEMYPVVDELCRQYLQITPPDPADKSAWGDGSIQRNFLPLVVDGVLARLLKHTDPRYSNPPMAAAHAAAYKAGLPRARAVQAASETAASASNRVLDVLRVRFVEARDAELKQAVFVAVDMLAQQWLLVAPPNGTLSIDTWLPAGLWDRHIQVVIDGASANLYAASGQPYFNAELARAHALEWTAGAANARLAYQGIQPTVSAFDRIMVALRTDAPGARDGAIFTALFPAIDTLARQYLQITPPLRTALPASWLPDFVYAENASLIISGTLSRLLLQQDPRYHSPNIAKEHAEAWAVGLERAREVQAAASASDPFSRMIAALQAAVPGLRTASLQQEVWNVVDEFVRNSLQAVPPDPSKPPAEWLPADEWAEYSRLIQAGALARILMQPKKPWTDLQMASVYQGQYSELVTLARADTNDGAVISPSDRVMQNLRVALPGSKDSAIHLALYNVVRNACWQGHIWVDTVPFKVDPNRPFFRIQPEGADIVRVSGIAHARLGRRAFQYSDGNLLVQEEVAKDDPAVYVTMALAPGASVQTDAPSTWIPFDLWSKKHQLFIDGVCAEMMLQANKPYSNVVLGQAHHRKYMAGLNLSSVDDRRQGLVGGPRWRFPRFTR